MIRDIYTRSMDDPNYQFGVMEFSDVYESIITKVKMILGTKPGTLLGDFFFGIGIEDYVFKTKMGGSQLESKIKQQFNLYIYESKDYEITPKISFGQADGYDYAIIDIFIDKTKVVGLLIA
jgi:hypothetical protein